MPPVPLTRDRAGNGIRTRDINLGKVALYQLSYSRGATTNIRNHRLPSKDFLDTVHLPFAPGQYTPAGKESQVRSTTTLPLASSRSMYEPPIIADCETEKTAFSLSINAEAFFSPVSTISNSRKSPNPSTRSR